MSPQPRAVIAEDEPLLAAALRHELAGLWPELQVLALVPDGHAAVAAALSQQPDVLFLDIRMPGLSGLDAAQAVLEDWPDDAGLPPLIVFVTAHDQHALAAFEHAAIDYVLKPVEPQRLARTCERLKAALTQRAAPKSAASPGGVEAALAPLRALLQERFEQALTSFESTEPLRVLQAGVGNTLHMVPVAEVIYLEAADKYVRVVTACGEHLLRSSLRELLPRLPADQFWQVHRSTVVRAEAIATVTRSDNGKLTLALRGCADKLAVSRLYAHRFKAM
jgi:DNA-binding LytR/AlgR family response regulator